MGAKNNNTDYHPRNTTCNGFYTYAKPEELTKGLKLQITGYPVSGEDHIFTATGPLVKIEPGVGV